MKKEVQAALMLLVGGTLLKISFSGTYVRYVKAGLLPLLITAGVALVVIAGVTIWQAVRSTSAHEHHDHDHGRVGWLLLLPALAILALSPPALGSFQASRSGTALSTQSESDFADLPAGDPVRTSVLDYAARAVFDEGRSLQGRTITLSGFIILGPSSQPYLARLVVSCCAADARPIKVGLTGNLPASLAADTWIEVDGVYVDRTDEDEVNGEPIPYIDVRKLRTIAAPNAEYES